MKKIFWSDQKADEVVNRKKFTYLNKRISKFKVYTVKTSASLSGVLHIGRLSDTIRGESVYKSLKEVGKKARGVEPTEKPFAAHSCRDTGFRTKRCQAQNVASRRPPSPCERFQVDSPQRRETPCHAA